MLDAVNKINQITRKLNNMSLDNKEKHNLRSLRSKLLNKITISPLFDKNYPYFLVPLIVPEIYVSYNTAIVGNSVNLLRNKYGPQIDSHRDIIRFNYAPTDGFEEHSGGKQTIRFCSYVALEEKKPSNHPIINNTVYKLTGILEDMKIIVFYKKPFQLKRINKNKDKFIKKGNTIHTILWKSNFFNDILNFHNIRPLTRDPQCGTGFMLLLCDIGIKSDIYGIDTCYSNDNYYYYWDDVNKKCTRMSNFHNYNDEFRVPLELDKLSLIKLYK